MSIDRYKNIAKGIDDFELQDIKPFLPTPSESDYKKGYITRYFVQLYINPQTPIFEISKISVAKYKTNPFYKTVALDWRIKGSVDDVKKSNKVSAMLASNKLPGVHLYLPNILQFYLDK